ncbi:MAG TPA: VWA domain-containing protein [Candidatus Sulfomarinibacteraceae bacterium]|nr:VWA domain-containing protein [Candidatus Sulfomarinibacteraceae bacterium]
MTGHLPDYYQILGLSPEATAEDIKAAAARLAETFPKEARDPEVNVAYRQLVEAYEALRDPDQRKAYDDRRRRRAPDLLQVNIQSSRRTIPALNGKQLLYILVMLHAPPDSVQTTLPLNLALIFDRSTSMRGRRLEQVKAATKAVVDKLAPDDVVSLVTFSDRASVVFPASRAQKKQAIIRRIQSVQVSGGTEIYQGLSAGMEQLQRTALERHVNYMALLTDGHTYGDEADCLALASQAARQSITLSAFGIGSDWNDRFLDQLVAPGGGHSIYVERPAQIVESLQEQIEGLGAIYAQNVRLEAQLPPDVACREAIKLSPFSQPLSFTGGAVPLGNLEMRTPLALLLELVVSPQKAGATLRLPLKIVADLPGLQVRERAFHHAASFEVVHHEPDLSPPPIVIKAVEMLNLHRMNEKAWEDFEAGKMALATRRMDNLSTRLMAAGHTRLAEQASLEKQRLAQMGALSADGRKKLKYGTRALITTAIRLKKDDD